MDSVADLYEHEAETYWYLANDRDFAAQTRAIVAQLGGAPQRAVEAFAGPAYHGACLISDDPQCQLLCVDTSAQMRDVACRHQGIAPEKYCVDRIERVLDERVSPHSLDLFLGLRFSMGHLEPADCAALLAQLGRCLRPGGIAVFEVYSPPLVGLVMRQPLAMERRVKTQSGEVGVVCPDGDIMWSETDWIIDVPWRVSWYAEDGSMQRQNRYLSTERLYMPAELVRMSQQSTQLQQEVARPELAQAFLGSFVLVLRQPAA